MSREGIVSIDLPIAVIASPPFLLTWNSLSQEEQARKIISGEIVGRKLPVVDLLVSLGFAQSKTQARALIKQGGVTVGPERTAVRSVEDFVVLLGPP